MTIAAYIITFSLVALVFFVVWSGQTTLRLTHKSFDAWEEDNKPYALINIFFIAVGLVLFIGSALTTQWWLYSLISGGGSAS